jgi:2,5-diketo-D-gluconate reductase A
VNSPPPTAKKVGCYWDWHTPGSAMLVSNRSLADIPPGTCTYVDVSGMCQLGLTAAGRLSAAGASCWTVHGENQTAGAQAAAAVADARAARAGGNPGLRFYWQLSAPKAVWMAVWSSEGQTAALVDDLVAWAAQHPDVAHGWSLDYEEQYTEPEPAAIAGLTNFLRRLKVQTGNGVNWWTSFNYLFEKVADIAALQPFIDTVEYGTYFNDLAQSSSAHVFRLADARALVQTYGYRPDQIMLGVGLSSYSWMGVNMAVLPLCAYQDYLDCDPPACANASAAVQVYASDRSSHSSLGGGGVEGRRWDKIRDDVASGRAVKGRSNATRPGYGRLSSYFLYYPDAARPATGELTFWNDLSDIDTVVDAVVAGGFGGVFTWVATSDGDDWPVHRHLSRRLVAGLAPPPPPVKVVFEPPVLAGESSTEHFWFPNQLTALTQDSLALVIQDCGDTATPTGNVSDWLVSTSGGRSWSHALENGPPSTGTRPHESWLQIGPDVHGVSGSMIAVGLEGLVNPALNGSYLIPSALLHLEPDGTLQTQATFNLTSSGFPPLTGPPASGNNAILLHDKKKVLMLSYGYQPGPPPAGVKPPPNPWPKYTLFVSESDLPPPGARIPVALDWKLRGKIECNNPWCLTVPGIEGPCEAQIVQMASGNLLVLMRFTAAPLMKSLSTDLGVTFSMPAPTEMWSVWANVIMLPNDVLVATAGRPGVNLWTCSDGRGENWTYHNVAAAHNAGLPTSHNQPSTDNGAFTSNHSGSDEDWSYTPVYTGLRSEADHEKCHDILPRQTTGYTSVTLLSVAGNTSTLVVAYDRLSNGWKGPTDGARWGGLDRVFTMRVHVSSHSRRSKFDDVLTAPRRSNDYDDDNNNDNDTVSSRGLAMPTVEVAPGVHMPMVNMGGYAHCHQRGCGGPLCRSVANCPGAPSNYSLWLALGNKGIDTAWQYFTQPTIKKAIAGLPRAAVFLTTKIPTGQSKTDCLNMPDGSPAISPDNVTAATNYYIAENLRELDVARVDMLLMHGPCATAELNLVAWKCLEDAQRRGDTRAIGVSNFDEPTLASLLPQAHIRPAINQCSFGVGNHLNGASGSLKYCQENNITFQADHTLDGSANSSLFSDPVVTAVAAAHGKSAAQILMKWVVQQGALVVTGSMSEDYDREDAGLWGWDLTAAEMGRLAALKTDESISTRGVCGTREHSAKGTLKGRVLPPKNALFEYQAKQHVDAVAGRQIDQVSASGGFSWANSTAGAHSWLVFDYHVSPANATALAKQHDFIWGCTPQTAAAWRKGNPDIIVSRYINGNRDGSVGFEPGWGNVSWWRENHPEWVMWSCPNSTGHRHIAGEASDTPLDWSNAELVNWQLERYSCPCLECPCKENDPMRLNGWNALAVDGYHFANFRRACGHYDRDWTDPAAKFITLYNGRSEFSDPQYSRDAMLWLSRFYAGLQKLPASTRPLLIVNFDLAFCKKDGCHWDHPNVFFVGNHSDGQIDEGAYTWSATGGVLRPEDQPAWLWRDTMLWASNLQQHGKAYYPIVESLNCTSPMQSAVSEDDSTLSTPYWLWYLASYLLAKGDASALYISPVFADAPVDRQHTVTMTYGQVPWYLTRYREASVIGTAIGMIEWTSNVTAIRRFTHGFVAANAGERTATFKLPGGAKFRDLVTNETIQDEVTIQPRNATVLFCWPLADENASNIRAKHDDDLTTPSDHILLIHQESPRVMILAAREVRHCQRAAF